MDYAVFDWSARQYRVYRDSRPAPLMADAPRCPSAGGGAFGMVDVNAAICPLPSDAQFVGWSPSAVGRVVRSPSGMPGVPGGWGARAGSPNLGGYVAAAPLGLGAGFVPDGLGYQQQCACGGVGQGGAAERPGGMGFATAMAGSVASMTLAGLLTQWVAKRLGM